MSAPWRSAMRLTIGEAEPAAARCPRRCDGAAVEAVEHALAIARRGCPGPPSRTLEHGGAVVAAHADVDAPAGRRVAHRVVDEVRDQRAQRRRRRRAPAPATRRQRPDRRPWRRRAARARRRRFARERGEVDRRRRRGRRTPGSSRASVSSCSTRRVARSRPPLSSASAALRSASVVARSASCACRCTAVSGVRNSCAASAMNARCAAERVAQAREQPVERVAPAAALRAAAPVSDKRLELRRTSAARRRRRRGRAAPGRARW